MNIKGKPGSKERLFEMFYGVNKTKQMNEQPIPIKDVINEGVNDNNREKVINYFYDILFPDEYVQNNPIYGEKFGKYISLNKDELNQLSNDELQMIWDAFAQADQESIEETTIDKKEESDPYGGARQEFQTGMGYGDEKPVNPKLRVKAPELDKFIREGNLKEVLQAIGERYSELDMDVATQQVDNESGERLLKQKFQRLLSDLEFTKLAKAYESLLRLKPEFRQGKIDKALAVVRDSIVDYLSNVKNMNVSDENVQNFFTDYVRNYALPISEEEENDGEEKVPSLDPNDVDGDGEYIEGGEADNEPVDAYDPDQILKGIEVEMEHTDDPRVALEIAMDHLEELPDYYTRLDTMEKEGEADLESLDGGDEIPDVEKENPELYPEGWKEMDGMFMNPDSSIFKHAETIKDADKDLEDTLLGYNVDTPNVDEEQYPMVGDPKANPSQDGAITPDLDEKQTFASREVDYENMDAYKRYQQLDDLISQKGFENVSPEEQDEYYKLWIEFGKKNHY